MECQFDAAGTWQSETDQHGERFPLGLSLLSQSVLGDIEILDVRWCERILRLHLARTVFLRRGGLLSQCRSVADLKLYTRDPSAASRSLTASRTHGNARFSVVGVFDLALGEQNSTTLDRFGIGSFQFRTESSEGRRGGHETERGERERSKDEHGS